MMQPKVNILVEFEEERVVLNITGSHESQDLFMDALHELWEDQFRGFWKLASK